MCGSSDAGFHLRIRDEEFWGYCLRNPSHKFRNLSFLFKTLGIDTTDLIIPSAEDTPKKGPANAKNHKFFALAEESEEARTYLSSRLFLDPISVCKKFDLRVAKEGRWVGRLLIPLTVGWTGRAMRSNLEPRYLSETSDAGYFKYGKGDSVLLVEGPLDAMRVATVVSDMTIVAMTGGRVSPAMLQFFRGVRGPLYYSPDSDVGASQRSYILQEIRLACPLLLVKPCKLPDGFKDPGEMPELEVKKWIYTL